MKKEEQGIVDLVKAVELLTDVLRELDETIAKAQKTFEEFMTRNPLKGSGI